MIFFFLPLVSGRVPDVKRVLLSVDVDQLFDVGTAERVVVLLFEFLVDVALRNRGLADGDVAEQHDLREILVALFLT